jgi:hypothetical protein
MNDYSVLSVLFAPIVIFLAALLVTGIAQIFTALQRVYRASQRPRPPRRTRERPLPMHAHGVRGPKRMAA